MQDSHIITITHAKIMFLCFFPFFLLFVYLSVIQPDLDECDLGTHDCLDTATCLNKIGGWSCFCNDGFEGDGNTYCEGKTNGFNI